MIKARKDHDEIKEIKQKGYTNGCIKKLKTKQ